MGKIRLRPGAVIAVAVAAGFLVWLLFISGDDDERRQGRGSGAVASSESELATLQDRLGHPVYWLGEREGEQLELTETSDGKVYVRYLDEGAEIGEPTLALTVGTYPFKNPYNALQVVSERPGAIVDETDDGALVVSNESTPDSVYLAYPDGEVQVEIYSPDAEQALDLATSGAVRPIG